MQVGVGPAEPRPCPCRCHRPDRGGDGGRRAGPRRGEGLDAVQTRGGVGRGADPGGSAHVSAEAVALWAHRGCCRSSGDRREGAGSVGRPRSSELNRLLQGRSLGRCRHRGRMVSGPPLKSRLISSSQSGQSVESLRRSGPRPLRAGWGCGRWGKATLPWGSPSETTDPQVRVVWSWPPGSAKSLVQGTMYKGVPTVQTHAGCARRNINNTRLLPGSLL